MRKPQYTVEISGKLYFQRRFPERIKKHPALTGKVHYRVVLKSDNTDLITLTKEVVEINQTFEDYISILTTANQHILDELDLNKKALAYLHVNELETGMLTNPREYVTTPLREGLIESGLFHDYLDYANQQTHIQGNNYKQSPTEIVQVQEQAWKLLNTSIQHQPIVITLTDCWSLYIKERGIEIQNRKNNREHTAWQLFVSIGGGDSIVNQDVVNSYLDAFIEKRLGEVRPQSVRRQLNTIIAALNLTNDKHRLGLNISTPRLGKKNQTAEAKPPLTQAQQHELLALIADDSVRSYKPWKELFVLLALQSGSHASELVRLRPEDLHLNNEVPYLTLNYQDDDGKTEDRVRYVPLVLQIDRIKELLDEGALQQLVTKTTDNISSQIKQLISKVDEKATAYSLRHTLKHNADIAGVDSAVIASIGGWSGKNEQLSKHMMGYGRESKEITERLEALRQHQLKIHSHLLTESVDNVLAFKKEAV